jgi:hypothetical protein
MNAGFLFFLFVLLSWSTGRIARFLHQDTLIEVPRNWLLTWLVEPRDGFRGRFGTYIATLLDCPWCLSIWVGAATIAVVDAGTPISNGYSIPLPAIWVPAMSMMGVVLVEYVDGIKQVMIKPPEK